MDIFFPRHGKLHKKREDELYRSRTFALDTDEEQVEELRAFIHRGGCDGWQEGLLDVLWPCVLGGVVRPSGISSLHQYVFFVCGGGRQWTIAVLENGQRTDCCGEKGGGGGGGRAVKGREGGMNAFQEEKWRSEEKREEGMKEKKGQEQLG